MREKFRNYFIGDYLKKTEDVFEHARAIMLLQFAVMFIFVFSLPIASDVALGYDKGLLVHSIVCATLITFPFMIKRLGNLDRAIDIFFIICFISSVFIYMMLSPDHLDVIGMAWTILFLFLSMLLQKGFSRILYCGLLGWLPLLYVIINEKLNGQITWDWIIQKGAAEPPVFLSFVPILLGMYAFWSHTRTIGFAKKTIFEQKEMIEEKNKNIHDSITYAKRLQEAILPPIKYMDDHLKEYFVLYRPKDIVAGDFYWFEKQDNRLFIAAGDCTGHGVPGAMVSVICSGALNRSVKEYKLNETGKILDKTRELVIETFEKSASEVRDGMDISLVSLRLTEPAFARVGEEETNEKRRAVIEFSGANNSLYVVCNGELKEFKADKQPIGKSDHAKDFITHTIDYQENMTLYLLTDGYADQFGGKDGKKFKYKPLLKLLVETSLLPMKEQSAFLEKKFTDWQGELEQVDDVCVIGVRV